MKAICYGGQAHMRDQYIHDFGPFTFPDVANAEPIPLGARVKTYTYRPQVYRGPNGFEVIVAFPDGTTPPDTLPAELMPMLKRV